MPRHAARLIAIAVAGVAVSGCATFTDNDVAARVGDAELSHAQLDQRLREVGVAKDGDGHFDGDGVRAELSDWIRRRVADEVNLFDSYAAGQGSLPVACIFVLQVADRATADRAVQRLDGGEAWESVAADVAPAMPAAGRQDCGLIEAYVPEIGEQLAALPASGDPAVIEIAEPPGTFVVRAQTPEELNLEQFAFVASQANPAALEDWVVRLQGAEVYVDPRFGVFDGARVSVVPIG